MYQELPPEIMAALKAAGEMLIAGLFSGMGGVINYFYEIDKSGKPIRLLKLFLVFTISWGVGAAISQFVDFMPDIVESTFFGSLFLAGVYHRHVFDFGKNKIKQFTGHF